jgi:hypothetical protein
LHGRDEGGFGFDFSGHGTILCAAGGMDPRNTRPWG